MADKGFDISGLRDLLKPLKVTLKMPTPQKRDSNRKMARKDVEETRRKAAVRIHVDAKMEQIKFF